MSELAAKVAQSAARHSAFANTTRSVFASALAFVVYYILRIRRSHVISSMERAGYQTKLAKKYAFCMFLELALSVGELLAVASGKYEASDFVDMDDDATARIKAARASGNVVLLCAHVSNWELVAMNAARKFPLALVARSLSPKFVDSFMQKTRTKNGVRVVSPNGALKEVSLAHARGEVVATVIDQVPARAEHADQALFLGQNCFVDRAPAVMCKRARAAVFVMLAARERSDAKDASSRVKVTVALAISREDVAKESAREIMRRATAALDAHVRAHPASWLWMHRRWKSQADIDAEFAKRARRAQSSRPKVLSAESFNDRQKAVIDSAT